MKNTPCGKKLDKGQAALRLRVWIEQDEGIYIGIGSTLLLQRIEKLGSLKKAAEELGMSYRRAWGKLKKTEARVGKPLVEMKKGQGQRFSLTPLGKDLMEKFLHFYLDVERYALERARDVLKMDVNACSEFYRDDTE